MFFFKKAVYKATTHSKKSPVDLILNLKFSAVFFGGALPAYPYIILGGGTAGQTMTFKNTSGNSVTMQFNNNITMTTSGAGVSSIVLSGGAILDVFYQNV